MRVAAVKRGTCEKKEETGKKTRVVRRGDSVTATSVE
jgi:hypothetical protein